MLVIEEQREGGERKTTWLVTEATSTPAALQFAIPSQEEGGETNEIASTAAFFKPNGSSDPLNSKSGKVPNS